MVTYAKEEIISSSNIVKKFSNVLNSLKKRDIEKMAILRNNKIEAVIIPLNEYEKLQEIQETIEYQEIYNIVKEREKTEKESISFDNVLKEYGINKNEL